MFKGDAPLYIPPRFDPALWRWLLGFAMRCNHRDWVASARAKAAMLNDSRQRIADWVRDYGLQCEFMESGEDYVFHSPRARPRPTQRDQRGPQCVGTFLLMRSPTRSRR